MILPPLMLTRYFRIFALLLLLGASGTEARGFFDWGKSEDSATITAASLPTEAREALALIRQGGPFPYRRDGIIFQNREKRLPEAASGYYREYTVTTPGSRDRGARRIISGGRPPAVLYYSDDHYRTFRRIQD